MSKTTKEQTITSSPSQKKESRKKPPTSNRPKARPVGYKLNSFLHHSSETYIPLGMHFHKSGAKQLDVPADT